jgi:hypothetical protein
MSGWIKLHRSLIEWEWYDDVNTRLVFIHCLLQANFKDRSHKGTMFERGSFPCGRDQLAKDVGITTQQLRTSIRKLTSTGEITIKSTNKGTKITLCNYEGYQDMQPADQPTSNQQVTNDQPASNHSIRRKEGKKDKNVIQVDDKDLTEEIYQAYPKKVGKGSAIKAIKKAIKIIDPNDLLEIVKIYSTKIDGKDKKFIPHPSTWFNDMRWEDDQSTWDKPSYNNQQTSTPQTSFRI